LKELPEAIVITVYVEFVIKVHGWDALFIRQDVAPLKDTSATINLLA